MEGSPAPAEPNPASQQDQSEADKCPSSNGDGKKWEAAQLHVLPVSDHIIGEMGATAAREFRPSKKRLEANERESVFILSSVILQQTLMDQPVVGQLYCCMQGILFIAHHQQMVKNVLPVYVHVFGCLFNGF